MDEPFERDVMEDLIDEAPRALADEAFDEPASMEAEGFTGEDAFSDERQDFEASAMDELLAEDGFEEGFEANVGDAFAADYGETNPMQAMEEAIADALEADDSDEFLRRVSRGIRSAANMARQVGRGVGQAARVVSPIASAIPLPQAPQ